MSLRHLAGRSSPLGCTRSDDSGRPADQLTQEENRPTHHTLLPLCPFLLTRIQYLASIDGDGILFMQNQSLVPSFDRNGSAKTGVPRHSRSRVESALSPLSLEKLCQLVERSLQSATASSHRAYTYSRLILHQLFGFDGAKGEVEDIEDEDVVLVEIRLVCARRKS